MLAGRIPPLRLDRKNSQTTKIIAEIAALKALRNYKRFT
jgi:hypothetical protein